ncbi:hypothetical protein L4C34_09740 [Vibrio profundum]|uniref:hypothetical protein n=1 Tax=Vibrio profundum TaxID=2910247 RepID=UPI003D12DEF2
MRKENYYNFDIQGKVFIMQATDVWDVTISEMFCQDIASETRPLMGSLWGMVVDLSQWGLCVPEVWGNIDNALRHLQDNKLICQAFIVNTTIHKDLMNKHQTRVKEIEGHEPKSKFDFFENYEVAIDWCNQEIAHHK